MIFCNTYCSSQTKDGVTPFMHDMYFLVDYTEVSCFNPQGVEFYILSHKILHLDSMLTFQSLCRKQLILNLCWDILYLQRNLLKRNLGKV